jgi:putative drug exporter of the RND superfamily
MAMFAKLGHAVAHHPWWVIAVGRRCSSDRAVCARAPGELGPTSFLPDSYESVKADEVATAAFPHAPASSAMFVARREDRGELTRADQSKLATIAGELGKARIPGGLEVVSGPEQVSPNGRVQLVQVAFSAIPGTSASRTRPARCASGRRRCSRAPAWWPVSPGTR